jgi:hypothetical protein
MSQNILSDSQVSLGSVIYPSSSASNIFDPNIDPSLFQSDLILTNPSSTLSYPPNLKILSLRNGGNKCVAYPLDTENKDIFDEEVIAFMDWWQDTDSARNIRQLKKKMIWGGVSWPSLDQNLAVSLQVYTKVEVRTIAMFAWLFFVYVVLCLRYSLFALFFVCVVVH